MSAVVNVAGDINTAIRIAKRVSRGDYNVLPELRALLKRLQADIPALAPLVIETGTCLLEVEDGNVDKKCLAKLARDIILILSSSEVKELKSTVSKVVKKGIQAVDKLFNKKSTARKSVRRKPRTLRKPTRKGY